MTASSPDPAGEWLLREKELGRRAEGGKRQIVFRPKLRSRLDTGYSSVLLASVPVLVRSTSYYYKNRGL